MRIEVPVYNQDDGSVKFMCTITENELQALLQFGLNAAVGSGLAQHLGVMVYDDDEETPNKYN